MPAQWLAPAGSELTVHSNRFISAHLTDVGFMVSVHLLNYFGSLADCLFWGILKGSPGIENKPLSVSFNFILFLESLKPSLWSIWSTVPFLLHMNTGTSLLHVNWQPASEHSGLWAAFPSFVHVWSIVLPFYHQVCFWLFWLVGSHPSVGPTEQPLHPHLVNCWNFASIFEVIRSLNELLIFLSPSLFMLKICLIIIDCLD